MGIEYFIQDRRHNRRFELGKGPMGEVMLGLDIKYEDFKQSGLFWDESARSRGVLTFRQIRAAGVDELARRFIASWDVYIRIGWAAAKFEDDSTHEPYLTDLARRVWKFCDLADWDIRVWNDTSGPPRGCDSWYDSPIIDSAYVGTDEHGGIDRL